MAIEQFASMKCDHCGRVQLIGVGEGNEPIGCIRLYGRLHNAASLEWNCAAGVVAVTNAEYCSVGCFFAALAKLGLKP